MKLAIIVQCHRYTSALEYTVNKLSASPDVFILIHVDAKYPISDFQCLVSENVVLVERRISVHWGGFSQVLATLAMMKELESFNYDYLSLISGDDVFVKSVDEFQDFLESNRGLEFIGVEKNDNVFVAPRNRVQFIYPNYFFIKNCDSHIKFLRWLTVKAFSIGLFSNKYYLSLPPLYKGCGWFTLSKECVSYVLEYVRQNKYFLSAFKSSYCGDEVLFQTIIMNSCFREKIYELEADIDDGKMALRYIDWFSGPELPKILTERDLSNTLQPGYFFARKLDPSVGVSSLKNIIDK